MKYYEDRPCTSGNSPEYGPDRAYEKRAEPWTKENNHECCKNKRHPLPKKILLECGFHPEDAIFEIEHGYVKEHQSFILDRVLVDTSCFCKPLVKIEFSSLVVFEAKAKEEIYEKELEVELSFVLVRICNKDEEVVQNWKFQKKFEIREQPSGLIRADESIEQPQPAEAISASSPVDGYGKIEVKISEPFTVTFCDRVCPDCCTYKMIVIGKDFKGKFEVLRVVKPDLSALAQDTSNDCCELSGV
jgi:hypothetical protein